MKYLLLISLVILSVSCREIYSPKPRGYFRIDLPVKEYEAFPYAFPYSFEVPVYGNFVPDTRAAAQPYWANIAFPDFDAYLHLTYKPIRNQQQLESFLGDAHTFVNRHIPKASGIEEELIIDPHRRVFGQLFHIKGQDVASSVQFFVTDSVENFLRGSLYFSVVPNNDSLAPVIDFLRQDVRHLLHTLQWE